MDVFGADRLADFGDFAGGGARSGWAGEKELFRRWLEGSMFARRSQETYLERTGAFLGWLESVRPAYMDALISESGRDEAVAAYVGQLRRPSTVNVTLAALASYYTWLGLGEVGVSAVRVDRGIPPTLTPLQRSRTLDVAALRSRRDNALFVMGLAGGLRESELAALEVDDVVLSAHSGSVRAPGPDDQDRVVGLQESARRVQLTWFAERQRVLGNRRRRAFFLRTSLDGPLSSRRIDEIVRSIGAEAGVLNLSPGVLRNTFERDLVNEGRELSEVAYLMGQAKPDRERVRALRGIGAGGARATGGRTARPVNTPGVIGEQLRIDF
ncbi:site-specific integrase [Nocardia sp. NPDC050710]|uniref:tyrosine-type recombinase/integrase n=1 Tax=Nocardia sp. NPDC050710 TaxID=3157220 RepID=UPI00340A6C84